MTATLADRRGSLTIDDEGTPTQRNVLIDNGRLVGLMQDRQKTRALMGREAHRQRPAPEPRLLRRLPRMTNTIMLGGDKRPAGDHRLGEEGPLLAPISAAARSTIVSGKFRLHHHRRLPDRGRQARRAGEGAPP